MHRPAILSPSRPRLNSVQTGPRGIASENSEPSPPPPSSAGAPPAVPRACPELAEGASRPRRRRQLRLGLHSPNARNTPATELEQYPCEDCGRRPYGPTQPSRSLQKLQTSPKRQEVELRSTGQPRATVPTL